MIRPVAVLLTGLVLDLRGGAIGSLPPACVVVSNHTHELDCLALVRALWPRRLTFNSQPSNFAIPGAGAVLRAFGTISVSDDPAGLRHFLRANGEVLDAGGCVVVYPEGNINRFETALQPFSRGAFALAVRQQVPVVPVTMVPRARRRGPLGRRRGLDLVVGPPLWPDRRAPSRVARDDLCRRTREAISRPLVEAGRTRGTRDAVS